MYISCACWLYSFVTSYYVCEKGWFDEALSTYWQGDACPNEKGKGENCLHLRTPIVIVWWLALQGCAFRGHNESPSSLSCENFLELVHGFAKMNTKIDEILLENTPKMPNTLLQKIQNEILHIMANRAWQMIRKKVEDKFFCNLVDEEQDISKRE